MVERVQGLELVVRERGDDYGVHRVLVVRGHPTGQVMNAGLEVHAGRRRHESGGLDRQLTDDGRPAVPDDDLDGPDLSGGRAVRQGAVEQRPLELGEHGR